MNIPSKLIIFVFLLSVAAAGPAQALLNNDTLYDSGIETVIGTVSATHRNTLEVRDEFDGRIKRFVYFGPTNTWPVGERIRVLYTPQNNMVQNVKKMTPVIYAEPKAQNSGYILHQK